MSKVISLTDVIKSYPHLALEDDVVAFDTDMAEFSKEDLPLRFDSLFIILVTQGECNVTIDLRDFHVAKNDLVVIQPKNYVAFDKGTYNCRMNVLACSRYIVEEVLPVLTDILPLLLHHRVEPVRHLTDEEARGMRHFYYFLFNKLKGPRTPFLRQKVLCILQAALFELLDIDDGVAESQRSPKSRKDEIMAKFIIAVSENFRDNRQVSFYAEKLCITPKHLSAVVKEMSGRTAGDWIENYVGMEAKVLLKTTDLTIQEIAAKLNFANQSFFGKYFKHLTGQSPSTYRKNYQLNHGLREGMEQGRDLANYNQHELDA